MSFKVIMANLIVAMTIISTIMHMLYYVSGERITIENAGFETDFYPVANNAYKYLTPPTGWTRYNPQNINVDYDMGILNPKGGTCMNDPLFHDSAPEGNQLVFIEQLENERNKGELGIFQSLTGNIVTVDTTYTLSVWIGNSAPNTWWTGEYYDHTGFPGYKVLLIAGNNILAEDDNTLSIPEGHWKQSVINVAISSGDPNSGKTLGIRLINKNIDNGKELGMDVYFDDVRLEAASFPTPNPTLSTLSPTSSTLNPTSSATLPSIIPIIEPTTSPTEYQTMTTFNITPTDTTTLFGEGQVLPITSSVEKQIDSDVSAHKEHNWNILLLILIFMICFVLIMIIILMVLFIKWWIIKHRIIKHRTADDTKQTEQEIQQRPLHVFMQKQQNVIGSDANINQEALSHDSDDGIMEDLETIGNVQGSDANMSHDSDDDIMDDLVTMGNDAYVVDDGMRGNIGYYDEGEMIHDKTNDGETKQKMKLHEVELAKCGRRNSPM